MDNLPACKRKALNKVAIKTKSSVKVKLCMMRVYESNLWEVL